MHGLDMSHNPHQLLREINRVLTPHGHLLVVGNNRWSLLGVWRKLLSLLPGRRKRAVREPGAGRLQDWLTLLDFAVAPVRHKLVLPLSGNNRFGRWLARVDDWLVEHNIPLGSSYIVFADKLVRGNIRTQSIEKTRARLMGLRVPKPVVGARGQLSKSSAIGRMKSVEAFTDGACKGNPGPGAGAFYCAAANTPGKSSVAKQRQPTTGWNSPRPLRPCQPSRTAAG